MNACFLREGATRNRKGRQRIFRQRPQKRL